jgi:hypothetical protein
MNKSQKPDYQCLGPDGRLRDSGGIARCTDDFFKPVRMLALPNGGLVALMVSFGGGNYWTIYSLDVNGTPARSRIYKLRSVGEVMFREVCGELTQEAKVTLKDQIVRGHLIGAELAEAALTLCRLETADDERVDGLHAKAEQFLRTHTTEQVEAHIASELAAYRESCANDGDEV